MAGPKGKRPACFGPELKITDECGEGASLEIVMSDEVDGRKPSILFVQVSEQPTTGSRFTHRGIVWELTKEHESYEDLWIEGKKTTWEACAAGDAGVLPDS